MQVDALSIVAFHDKNTGPRPWPAQPGCTPLEGSWTWIAVNHRCNCLLWDEEERARLDDVELAEIAISKRLIDRHQQQRSDAVERIDEALLAQLSSINQADTARLSSETAGAMIDRMSVLALQIAHLRDQTRRCDVAPGRLDLCCATLQRLLSQRNDLACCLDRLLTEARHGLAYFKLYRQFTVHDDKHRNSTLFGNGMPSLAP